MQKMRTLIKVLRDILNNPADLAQVEERGLLSEETIRGALEDWDEYSTRLTLGHGLEVYGDIDSILRAQQYVLLDSTHSIEKEDVRRILARDLQEAERKLGARIGLVERNLA